MSVALERHADFKINVLDLQIINFVEAKTPFWLKINVSSMRNVHFRNLVFVEAKTQFLTKFAFRRGETASSFSSRPKRRNFQNERAARTPRLFFKTESPKWGAQHDALFSDP